MSNWKRGLEESNLQPNDKVPPSDRHINHISEQFHLAEIKTGVWSFSIPCYMPRPKDYRLKYNSTRREITKWKSPNDIFQGAWSTASWHEKDLGAEMTPPSYSCQGPIVMLLWLWRILAMKAHASPQWKLRRLAWGWVNVDQLQFFQWIGINLEDETRDGTVGGENIEFLHSGHRLVHSRCELRKNL